MDRLEQFIVHHRDELDPLEPDRQVWKKLSRQTGYRRKHTRYLLSRAALYIVITCFSSLLLWTGGGREVYRTYQAGKTGNYPIVRETENYYNKLILDRMNEARPVLARYPDLQEELQVEMEVLDSIGREIKEDLKDQVAKEEVLEALIQNYRIRIRLLEDMISKISTNEQENSQNGSHEI